MDDTDDLQLDRALIQLEGAVRWGLNGQQSAALADLIYGGDGEPRLSHRRIVVLMQMIEPALDWGALRELDDADLTNRIEVWLEFRHADETGEDAATADAVDAMLKE